MLLHSLPVRYLYNFCIEEASTSYSTSSFLQATVALLHKKVSSHGTCQLQRHTLCGTGSVLLFKTERVLRAIEHISFCQLWIISTNY